MQNIDKFPHHPMTEEVVQILSDKTQNSDKTFFRMMFSYFLAKVSSMMRVKVHLEGTGEIPVNAYVINLASSGSGKGRSINIIEDEVINRFRELYLGETFPHIAEQTLSKYAIKKSHKPGSSGDPNTELEALEREFEQAGPMVFGFDSGTSAAVKQMRHKLLLAGSGSINMEIDEIGSNLLGNMEVLNSFLELYDVGKIKQKLTKHTRENARGTELFGNTPSNMLLFGTPTKLLDGAKTEQEFSDMLETGYARRCFFGFSRYNSKSKEYSAEDIYNIFTDTSSSAYLSVLSNKLMLLAEAQNHGTVMQMDRDVTIKLLEYRLLCDKRAEAYSEYEETRKAEMKHRYFKVAKMAGTYAFVDQAPVVEVDHLQYAIALAEESGRAFEQILRRDRPYVKLATYICSIGREVTQADLIEDLPFYRGTEANRRDTLKLAIAHGYHNNQVITMRTVDGIDFYTGKALAQTNLESIKLSYSKQITTGYENKLGKWQGIHKLCSTPGIHWCNHHLYDNEDKPNEGGYRDEQHIQPGFNVAVLDVDGTANVNQVRTLLNKYTWYIHTTKSHTDTQHSFRIVVPLSHVLELDKIDYKAFMANIYQWLPFPVDTATTDRCRKWETFPGDHWFNNGELLDALQFIPNTKKANETQSKLKDQTNLTALERWFVNNMEDGNRNNMLFRYACALVDLGQDIDSIKNNIISLNDKLVDKLDVNEILGTIMVSVSKRLLEKSKT